MMSRNEKTGRFESAKPEATEESYGFYSKLLKKPFDTLEDLKAAEAELKAEEAKKANAAEVKKAKVQAIEEAYKKMVTVEKEARKTRLAEINEANKKYEDVVAKVEADYNKLKADFIKEYGSFHMSYYNNNGQEQLTFSELIHDLFGI